MTVGELREALERYPDGMKVTYDPGPAGRRARLEGKQLAVGSVEQDDEDSIVLRWSPPADPPRIRPAGLDTAEASLFLRDRR